MTSRAVHVIHIDGGGGLSLCKRAFIGPARQCWHCRDRSEAEDGPWVICGDGKVQHLERRLDACRATPSDPVDCQVCARTRDAREAARRASEHRDLARAEAKRREREKRRWPDDWGKLPVKSPGARNVYAGSESQ